MKPIWTSAPVRMVSKYGENAPAAAVCCNACRTCMTTNIVGLGLAAIGSASYGLTRVVTRLKRGY